MAIEVTITRDGVQIYGLRCIDDSLAKGEQYTGENAEVAVLSKIADRIKRHADRMNKYYHDAVGADKHE